MRLSDLIRYCADEGQYGVPAAVTGFGLGLTITAAGPARYVLLERDEDGDDD